MKKTQNDSQINDRYSENELMARLKFIVGICLAITLMGIVFVVLYSIIFVTQPLGAISPVDSKFFELIIPIATFLTGTLSGIMLAGNNKEAQMKALEAANTRPTMSPTPTTGSMSMAPSMSMSHMTSPQFGMNSTRSSGGFRNEPEFELPNNGLVSNGGKFGPVQPPHPEI
jgi:hypothetical protein